jgi:hypothetical protein
MYRLEVLCLKETDISRNALLRAQLIDLASTFRAVMEKVEAIILGLVPNDI